jgi:cytochrome P450
VFDEIDVASAAFQNNPYPIFRRMRDLEPILKVKVGRRPIWLVTRYDDVASLLKDTRFVKDQAKVAGSIPWVPAFARPLARNMLDVDEPDHRRLRALVGQAFSARIVESIRGRTEALVEQLLEQTSERDRIDVVADYAVPIPTTIIAEILGIPVEDREPFRRWTKVIVVGDTSALAMLRAMPAVLGMVRYLRRLVSQKRVHPGNDLISALIAARDGNDSLSEDELLAMIFLLLVAGHETTTNLITNALYHLSENREQRERLIAEPDLAPSAIEELLRYDGPLLTATERYTVEPTVLSGVTIPKGAVVYGAITSANRDERVFAEPDTLDLARKPNRHLSFGDGPHFCAGAALARMEAQIAIPAFLARFPYWRPPENWMPRWKGGIVLRGMDTMPLVKP